jgi:hypothetical protein
MRHTFKLLSVLLLSISASADSLTLSSNDIAQGKLMAKAHEYNGFGCSGGDLSPHLKWSNVPKGTKSFAITAYDPDAPTGSGWWHWQVINIPINVLEIPTGAGNTKSTASPMGSSQIKNDYGSRGFGGACPPLGHGIHHYRFTLHAISVEKLELPDDASGALAGYMINANSIASSSIESLYKRD